MMNCEFHPAETAVANCDGCRKLICVMDKRIHSELSESGDSQENVYCPSCFQTLVVDTSTSSRIRSLTSRFYVPILLVPVFAFILGPRVFPLLFLITVLIVIAIFSRIIVSNHLSNSDPDLGKTSYSNSGIGVTRYSPHPSAPEIAICPFCSKPVGPDDEFCINCGNRIGTE